MQMLLDHIVGGGVGESTGLVATSTSFLSHMLNPNLGLSGITFKVKFGCSANCFNVFQKPASALGAIILQSTLRAKASSRGGAICWSRAIALLVNERKLIDSLAFLAISSVFA